LSDENFLSRWSRRKIEARSEPDAAPPAAPPVPQPPAPSPGPRDDAPEDAAKPLPSLESLSPESDFAPFMKPEVEPGMRRQALKKLFGDARLYPMDGLDVYIDDYGKPDPLPEGWLGKLEQLARMDEAHASGPLPVAAPSEVEAGGDGQPAPTPDAVEGAEAAAGNEPPSLGTSGGVPTPTHSE
jgi:hypothetical protein